MLEAASELDLGPAVSVAESLSPQSRRRFEEAGTRCAAAGQTEPPMPTVYSEQSLELSSSGNRTALRSLAGSFSPSLGRDESIARFGGF